MSDFEKLQETVYQLLKLVGENPDREGLLDTPKRVAKMYQEVFSGLGRDPKDEFTAVFSEGHEEVVLVKDIPFHSMCEHHLLPFYGVAVEGGLSGECLAERIIERFAAVFGKRSHQVFAGEQVVQRVPHFVDYSLRLCSREKT